MNITESDLASALDKLGLTRASSSSEANGVTLAKVAEKTDQNEKKIESIFNRLDRLASDMSKMPDLVAQAVRETASRSAPNMQNVWAMISVLVVVGIAFIGLLIGVYIRDEARNEAQQTRDMDRLERRQDVIQAREAQMYDFLRIQSMQNQTISPAVADALATGKITIHPNNPPTK